MRYDAVVVGAGSAGCMAATTLVSKGFKVLSVDSKKTSEIGNKVCGNALGSHHLKIAQLKLPSDVVSNSHIEGFYIYAPNGARMDVPGGEFGGVMLHRRRFGQFLLHEALSHGVTLKDNTPVSAPLIDSGRITGVITGNGEKIHADVIVDATGFKSPLRMKLPLEWNVEKHVEDEDVVVSYRENRRLRKRFHKPEYCEIHLDQEKYPLGYAWIFPQDEYTVNVGLGVAKIKRNGKPAYPHPRQQLYETILKQDLFEGSELIPSGDMGPSVGGMDIPVRRSLHSLVVDGLMFTGEAGFIINPPTAGGNGPALVSGKIAGECAAEALEKEDTSRRGLWKYNERYFTEVEYGAKYFALDAFRILLQSLSNRDLNFAIGDEIIKGKDLVRVTSEGHLSMGYIDKTVRALKGLRNISLMDRVRFTSKQMKAIRQIGKKYPSVEDFSDWDGIVTQHFKDAKTRCAPHVSR